MPRELREVWIYTNKRGVQKLMTAAPSPALRAAAEVDGTIDHLVILTPKAAAVLAAAEAWKANQRGWLQPLDEALCEAVDAYRAAKGEG
jgi:hypothetical protein